MRRLPWATAALLVFGLSGCLSPSPEDSVAHDPLDAVADGYVRLVLAVGRHDDSYVDAYYGPPEIRAQVEAGEPAPLPDLLSQARDLLETTRAARPSARRTFLDGQLVAVEAFIRLLSGETLGFTEEARLLYDHAPPRHAVEEFEAARAAIDVLLPGDGDLAGRLDTFRAGFVVPDDRLALVVDRCLAMTREKTRALVELPAGESFEVAFVSDKPWGAYNWYKGGAVSLIEVNTDLPIRLPDICDTMAHEGYPGHHTFNALLEDRLVRGRGWQEFTVYPLHSPQSLLAEGTAESGLGVILTREEWTTFLEELAPEAGLAGVDIERYLALREARRPLRYVGREAARMLLDGEAGEDEVVAFLMRYGLATEQRARQNVAFYRAYRSYVINYTAGEDLVDAYIGEGPDRVERFLGLLQRPVTPSEL